MFRFSLCILFVAPSLINYSRPCGQVEGARVWWSPAPLDIWTFRASWIRIAWLQIVTCLNFWEKVGHKKFNLNIKNDHLIMLRKMFRLILFFLVRALFFDDACLCSSMFVWLYPGWQNLAAFRRGKKWQWKFFKRIFTIFATNASFLCVIAQKVRKSRQILIGDKIAYIQA